MASTLGEESEMLGHTQRPRITDELANSGRLAATGNDADGSADEQMDPRADEVQLVPVHVDMPSADLAVIMGITLRVYNTHVLVPTRNTWRKDYGSRRELEREVARTAVSDMARDIKRAVDTRLGGCWHVIHGSDFGTYVTHQRQCFCHFQLDGANVVVWRHGM